MREAKDILLVCAVAAVVLATGGARADINWNISYLDGSGGFSDPTLGAGRRQAVTAVTSYLNSVLDADGTVDFRFNVSLSMGAGPLATSAPRFSSSPNGYQNGHLFTHATTGIDPDPANPDATATVDFGFTWNNGIGQPKPFEVDLQSVLLHEFTHSLGILSRVSSSGQSNITNSDPGVYSVYNSFLRVGNTNGGTPLFGVGGDYLGTAQDLVTPSPGIYFWGASAMAANGGKPVRVFVQNTFNASSISHLAAASVMQFSTAAGAVQRRFSAVDLGVLRDLGWTVKHQGPGTLAPSTFKILTVNPGPTNSDNLNGPNILSGGYLGDREIEESGRLSLFVEDPATARPAAPGGNTGGALTQLSHPDAPGAIALLADDSRETAIGMTWFAVDENLAVPVAANMATRYAFKANPNVRGGVADGTFADFTLGTPQPGMTGGAAETAGVGIRLHASGPKAGQYELFDGTSGRPMLEDSGQFLSALQPGTDDFFDVAIEIIGATFDVAMPEHVNVYLADQLIHSFITDGGIAATYLSFYGGPTAGGAAVATGQAVYAFSAIDIGVVEVPEPTAAPLAALAGLMLARRRVGTRQF